MFVPFGLSLFFFSIPLASQILLTGWYPFIHSALESEPSELSFLNTFGYWLHLQSLFDHFIPQRVLPCDTQYFILTLCILLGSLLDRTQLSHLNIIQGSYIDVYDLYLILIFKVLQRECRIGLYMRSAGHTTRLCTVGMFAENDVGPACSRDPKPVEHIRNVILKHE